MRDDDHTVEALRDLGVSEGAIERARERGRLEDAVFDPVLRPGRQERTVSARDIEAAGGLLVAETQELVQALGLAAPEASEPFFTPAEAEVYTSLGQLRDIWPREVALRVGRVYGEALAAIAGMEVRMFRLNVQERLRTEGHPEEGLAALSAAMEELLPLADPLLVGVHRRFVELELARTAMSEAEGRTATKVPGTVEVSLLFCDLKNFTAFVDARGDEAGVAAVDAFAQVVAGECDSGRVVKGLGDGFMLAFPDATAAVEAGLRIIERMAAEDAPDVHASVHAGPAIAREGDYIGRTVNLAARLLNLSGARELVASTEVAEQTGHRFHWESRGTTDIRGFAESVAVCRVKGRKKEEAPRRGPLPADW